jgi:hypothetical protein
MTSHDEPVFGTDQKNRKLLKLDVGSRLEQDPADLSVSGRARCIWTTYSRLKVVPTP